ncbi:MAG: efflux RND transporter periplasmic adaptor subunit [Gemmatimonadetes bacterium]|nr:efflux RND transporter periplasmic adaptor subunit [Gemmatimonadota bacterium]
MRPGIGRRPGPCFGRHGGRRLRRAPLTAALATLALWGGACGRGATPPPAITTATVGRRPITVDAQATGVVEPINVIEVKSKASGQIVRMPVETGSQVRAGDLLVQVDTRDVKNQYEQAAADLRSAQAALDVAQAQKQRTDGLYATRIITTQEYEAAQLALTQAQGQVVRATTNVDLAKQRLEDATVVAPVDGTVIEKPVSLGQVIASATGSVTGGTTLLRMADLSKVRMRALVNETDIGSIRAGQPARVTVDAYPDRPFDGLVEKVEPQAVVQQSVTMFPVIVSLQNREGLLKPGMNGEVSVLVERRPDVLAVSNDAVRTVREAATAAALLGLNADTVVAAVRAQQAAAVRAPQAGTVRAQRAGAAGARTSGSAATSPPSAVRPRAAVVFVREAGRYAPRLVRLGATNYDDAEVLAGLAEGDTVALLNVAALQARRAQQNERFRTMTGGGGVPGVSSAPGSGGGGTGGGGGRPGGR